MESWIDIINEEEANNNHDHDNDDNDDNHIGLPLPQIIDLNLNGTLQKEITYHIDENDKIIRIETIFEIVDTKKTISKAAINRNKNWVKFGQCKHVKKGEIERGVTTQREGNFQFIWNDKNGKKIPSKLQKHKTRTRQQIITEQKEEKNNDSNSSHNGSTGYKAPHLRHDFVEPDPVEIKISNLPQWTTWNDVKQLIDAFYRKYLKQRYIPKYKIRMIPSNRTLEEWASYPNDEYCKKRLAEYDRLAIIEFENAENAQKAIQTLNGHRYEYNVLYVEKAKPRNISR